MHSRALCGFFRSPNKCAGGNETVFNEHISDNFPGDGATGMLMYMEHLPFIDSLVTGEVFDCECRERSAWTDRD